MLGLHVWLLVHGCFKNFPNRDEIGHLPASVSYWKFGRFDLYEVNPPITQLFAGLPAAVDGCSFDWSLFDESRGVRPEFKIGIQQLRKAKVQFAKEFVWPRIFCIPFSIMGALVLINWMRAVLPSVSCNVICAYWCFCPNILAYAPTIIPDVGSVSLGLLTAYCFSIYVNRSSNTNAAICGFSFGLALLSKLTWLSGFVSFPTAVFYCLWLRKGIASRAIPLRFADLAVCFFIAIVVLNAGYLFEGSLTRLGDYEFVSHALGGADASLHMPNNRFVGSLLSSVPVPLPKNFLEGVDFLKYEVETKYWSFLMGEWRKGSWPYYYLMTTLFKTPLPLLFAAGIGVCLVLRFENTEFRSAMIILGFPTLLCFLSVSLQGGFNHHHRYVLMIYPFIFALAAYVASPVGVNLLRFRFPFLGPKKLSIAVPLTIILVTLSAASSLRVHPYYTSYFNTLAGGPDNGWRLLGHSNIDWGQDILEVEKWLNEHPDRRPLVMDLDYFDLDGELFDVTTSDPMQLPKDASIDGVRKSINETQWWIISVKKLYNHPGHDGLEYLQQIAPLEKIAYAYHVYRIDPLPIRPLDGN